MGAFRQLGPPRVGSGPMALPHWGKESQSGSRVRSPEGRRCLAMMFWYGGHWVLWQAALMGVAMVVFWALVLWAVYYFVVIAQRETRRPGPVDAAKTILDQRLARGEIDAEEYGRLRDLL